MGGYAFATAGPNGEPPLDTPRMTSEVYEAVKNSAMACVSTQYSQAFSLPEAPEKESYGDVDLFVAAPAFDNAVEHIANSLRAKRVLENGPTVTMAIPRSDQLDSADQVFVQLDIRRCDEADLTWLLFLHSYGDLGQILGICNNRYGFTANDKGFHVRIEEQETLNRKSSFIYLSNDPGEVMRFLHLDPKAYAEGFETLDQLFEWLCHCRTISPRAFEDAPLNSKERSRRATRSMYQRFFYEWLPAFEAQMRGTGRDDKETSRQELLRQATAWFGKEDEYENRMTIVCGILDDEQVWRLVLELLQSCTTITKEQANEVVRSLKRWVYLFDGHPHIREVAEMDDAKWNGFGVWLNKPEKMSLEDDATEWILKHYEEVKILERKRRKQAKNDRASVKLDTTQNMAQGSD